MEILIACNLLLPALLIVAGALLNRRPPRKITALYGYRTERSMKNEDTWQFANKYSGALIWKIGWIALAVAAVLSIALWRFGKGAMSIVNLLLTTAQCGVLLAVIPVTERALKDAFDDEGRRKRQ